MKRIYYALLALFLSTISIYAQKPATNRRLAAGQSMERQGLVNIKRVVPSIKVALMYARTDNFCNNQYL